MGSEIEAYLKEKREVVEAALDRFLPPSDEYPPRIHEAIRYAAFGPGKRLRPILVLATTEIAGGADDNVLEAAAALEFIHAATLVLDDLPAMDNASLRRGRAACHKVYGEADTILAAVALLTHAFGLVALNGERLRVRRERLARAVREVALATGSVGLVGGQHMDLEVAGKTVDLGTLEYIHSHKTGHLFILAATLGPILFGAGEADITALGNYAKNLGLAFQVVDDLLDREATPEIAGKDTGRDRTSFLSLVAPAEARALVDELVKSARGWLKPFGARAQLLHALAARVAEPTS